MFKSRFEIYNAGGVLISGVFCVARCLREQERVRHAGHRMAAHEDLPQRDAEADPSEHLSRVLSPRGQTLKGLARVPLSGVHPFQ